MALRLQQPATDGGPDASPNREPIRVLVADDYAPMRLGVKAILESEGFEVCAEAADAGEAVAAALRERPDVCLLDIKMPGDGVAAAARITGDLPETVVVMLTSSAEEEDFVRALRAGAAGYLLKDTDATRLPAVLRGVLEGDSTVPRALVARVVAELGQRERRRRLLEDRGVTLTSREHEILELLREGLTTGQIAERLFVSQVTVRTHVSSILHKLGVEDRAAAIRLLETL